MSATLSKTLLVKKSRKKLQFSSNYLTYPHSLIHPKHIQKNKPNTIKNHFWPSVPFMSSKCIVSPARSAAALVQEGSPPSNLHVSLLISHRLPLWNWRAAIIRLNWIFREIFRTGRRPYRAPPPPPLFIRRRRWMDLLSFRNNFNFISSGVFWIEM